MSAVGTVTFLTLKREPTPPGEQVEDVTRENVDGIALRRLGTRGKPFRVIGVNAVTDGAARKTFLTSCLNLQGKIVTITDDWNVEWPYVAILDVQPQRSTAIAGGVGSLANQGILVTVEFTCLDTRATA